LWGASGLEIGRVWAHTCEMAQNPFLRLARNITLLWFAVMIPLFLLAYRIVDHQKLVGTTTLALVTFVAPMAVLLWWAYRWKQPMIPKRSKDPNSRDLL
jgi:uncharacterized membrane-anchored protein YitT (DUF2179 family)